ncbi:MAG TPA: hypothetical protein VLQ91_02010 [Draconibacterium sp.]|nr:hypothetical protein [Draconibacterium sp.]
MQYRIILSLLFLVSILPETFSAQRDSSAERIFSLIYNQQFTEAEKLLEASRKEIDPFYFSVLKLDLFWWKYSLSRTKTDAQNLNFLLDQLAETPGNSTNKKITELIRLSYQMRFEVKQKNYLNAFFVRSDVQKQLELLQKEKIVIPADQQKLFDLYVILLQYSEHANPFSFSKKTEKKADLIMKLTRYCAGEDLIVSTLAHYFLGRIYTKIEKQPEKGREHFQVLAQKFPQNRLFTDLAKGLAVDF